ncbi:MAG: NAD(P)H-hydrate dehydratase [Deltaproteobacteria bacterium]|nr:NAD(P)H-hydrate dehydratase [Deltaproteobacteria bacterium]
MRELDRLAIEGRRIPGRVLMETAGLAVADHSARMLPQPGRVAVVCGTGNNGGDGFVAARSLQARGYEVRVFIIGDRERVKGDARLALDALVLAAPQTIQAVNDAKGMWSFAEYLRGARLAVDALFGTGLSSDVKGLAAEVIDVLNESDTPVLAVDIPSGVDADTGLILGRAVTATATVTFAFPKRGHYQCPGAMQRGTLEVVDIGIAKALAEKLPVAARLLGAADGPRLLPPRPLDAHKGHFGHALVLAGSRTTPGAAVLALQGALRAGAGLVSFAADAATLAAAPARPPEVMLRLRDEGEAVDAWLARALAGVTAVVAGPGIRTDAEAKTRLQTLMCSCKVPLVLDADALNLLAATPDLFATAQAPLVLTPHPKEMARLTGTSVAVVQRDRIAAALQLSSSRRAVVVLKGAGTVVASPEGEVAVIDAGNPGMASGGTGDVLAGIIGGFLAQGLGATVAAELGALVHGVAGDHAAKRSGQTGLIATDIVSSMGAVFAAWQR